MNTSTSGVAGGFSISFQSDRAPVWGDIYVKGGSSSYAFNVGNANPASTDIHDFVARPDGTILADVRTGVASVPEPATLVACGVGLGMVGLLHLRRQRRRRVAR